MTDKKEFERIFRQHYGRMYRLAQKMLGDEADSKDVVSDVFAHLLDSSTDLRSETLLSFLLTSVRNRCINLLVRRRRASPPALSNWRGSCCALELPSPVGEGLGVRLLDDSTTQEQLETLYRYISGHMPELTQNILRLRYQQGLKYREIAETLQVSEVTVHNHLSQSLKQLKNLFKSLGYGIK